MPKEVTNWLCVHCSKAFTTEWVCDLHEKQHQMGFNQQSHFQQGDKYPNHITLQFEGNRKIQYWALESDNGAQELLKEKI